MAIFACLQIILVSLISFILMIGFIHNRWTSYHLKRQKNIPPSPWKLPIIGNLHQLGSNPHRAIQVLSQKHGPLMLLHFGNLPTLVASSAEVAQEIMKTNDLSFCSRPNLTIPNIVFYGSKDIGFAPFGEYWRQLKSILVLRLLSNTRVKSYQNVRENEIGHMINVLGESYGITVDIGALFISYANNVVCKVAMGKTFDGIKHINLLTRFINVFTAFTVGNYIPWLSWADRLIGSEKRAKQIAKEFDEFLEGVIEEHEMKKKREDGESDEEQDFVDILLGVQKDNTSFNLHRDSLKAVILDVFAGGTDTTFTSLEWAMSEIIKNPRIMKTLQQEVTEIAQGRSMISEDDLEKMKYLKAVLKESFRLHAPVPLLLPRKAIEDVKLMGYDIAAETQVIVNAWAIGRDPALWDEPLEFRPERFLKNPLTYPGFHFEWIPFGAGRRSCPGMQFSVVAIELALANIVYKFDLALPNGIKNEDLDMGEAYGVSLHRKSSLLVTTTPRSNSFA